MKQQKTILLVVAGLALTVFPVAAQEISQKLWSDICKHHENAIRAIEILDSSEITVFGDNTGHIKLTLKDQPAIVEAIKKYQRAETEAWSTALRKYNEQQLRRD